MSQQQAMLANIAYGAVAVIGGIYALRNMERIDRRKTFRTTHTVPLAAGKGASVTSEAELAWALAGVVSVCFTARDHLGIYTALGAGENYSAIERTLNVAVRERHPLPARLISALGAWLDCYVGNEHEPTTRSVLNRVAPPPLPTTAPPLRNRAGGRSSSPSITRSANPITTGTRHVAPERAVRSIRPSPLPG
jgi:hypothetical protein